MLKNILDIPFFGSIIRSTWSWRLLRLAMLGLLLVMIAYGWHQHAIPGVDVRDPLMYANFATFSLWVLWMMGMVAVALFLGRSWCTACPVGWINGLGRIKTIEIRKQEPSGVANPAVTIGYTTQDLIRNAHFPAIVGRSYPKAQDIGAQ